MAKYVTVVSSDGQEFRMKLSRVRELGEAGQWDKGIFHFTSRAAGKSSQPSLRHSPSVGRITSRLVSEYGGSDSGFGFLRYPMKSGESGGFAAQYPALSRQRAGL